MPDLPNCPPDTLAARVTAAMDSFNGRDNSKAVEEAFPADYAIQYSAYKSRLDNENALLYANIGIKTSLESPYKEYFKTPVGEKPAEDWKNRVANMAMGNDPDHNVTPTRILGDEIVRPVEDAFRVYVKAMTDQHESGVFDELLEKAEGPFHQNEELQAKLLEIQADTGYIQALDEAAFQIEARFGQGGDEEDHARYRYGMEWVHDLQRSEGYEDTLQWALRKGTNNLVKNSIQLKWLLSFRHFFDKQRALYHFGADNFVKAVDDWNKVKGDQENQELIKAGVRDSRFYTDKGVDILHPIVEQNKGITYFAAKRYALSQGKTEAQARLFARNAVEQLHFQTSFVNKPRSLWKGTNRSWLALFNFHMQQRRWYMDMWRMAKTGYDNRNTPQGRAQFRQAMGIIGMYLFGNALINGPSADVPDEMANILKIFYPRAYAAMKKGDKYSLAGALNLDLADLARIPLTGVGVATKLALYFQKLGKVQEAWQHAANHPTKAKTLVHASAATLQFLPPGLGIPGLKEIGNDNLASLMELTYRLTTGDYTRYTYKGKKYETSAGEEIMNAVRGGKESLDREIQKAELNAEPSGQHSLIHMPRLPHVRGISK